MQHSTLCAAVLVLTSAVSHSFAQSLAHRAEVLQTERRQDVRERNALASVLDKTKISLRLEDASPKDLAEQLNAFAGEKTMFLVRRKDGARDWESIDLKLEKRPFLQALSIVSRISKVRFVFRSGVVMIVHEDEIKPERYLRIYDLRMATRKIRSYRAPRLDLPIGEGNLEEPEEEDGGTVSGFDADRFEEMIRASVLPRSWDDGASITQSGGIFFVRQSEKGHRELAGLLRQFGVAVLRERAPRLRRKRVTRKKKAVKRPSSTPRRGSARDTR